MYMYVCILKCTSIYIYMLQVSYHNVFLPLPTHDVRTTFLACEKSQ